ncbi:nucleotide sugar dehydrogenase [Natranaerobius thermophilus]|uniref:Nucleotide sugar dehydrogenase n=1 Tax=Natranaerobius thermophilus (strain ATCC BAA-1301 / DSM 18059 / JW/NM-WN-LF) TaxID=457570 RepID=B2A0R3_NATTJ|nr:nucleotide sugar dehydrogenase [Natranaerobius thermophilus]ACB85943.1 nucleotide sugar dehydrogenase [Natranaerobius thermophilus JW/NM-WN-LF]
MNPVNKTDQNKMEVNTVGLKRNNTIAVFGQGYVGLPLALSFAMKGFKVFGVDINQALIKELKQGKTKHLESYQGKSIQEILQEELDSGRYIPVDDYRQALTQAGIIVVTVGAPIKDDGEVNNSPLKAVAREIGQSLKKDDLVLVRSTVVPGTTERVIQPILESESGLVSGEDFDLAYSSERIAEGKAFLEFSEMPTLVAGVTDSGRKRASELLASLFGDGGEIVVSPSIEAVELSKVLENLSRDINIGMVNEFAGLCEELDLDIHHIIDLANTHKRVNLLRPGPGVGGFCIPNAYYYLLPRAREAGLDLDLSSSAREINDYRPRRVVERLKERLQEQGKSLDQCKIAILGLAMKDYSSDHRQSPALDIVELLLHQGGEVNCYDPEVSSGLIAGQVNDLWKCVQGASAVIFLTRQEEFDNLDFGQLKGKMLANPHSPLLLDPKKALSREEATKEGIQYVIL